MIKLFKLFLLACALAALIGIADMARGQEIYTRGMPEAAEHVEYSAWAWNNRAGFDSAYAGEIEANCTPGTITVRRAKDWQEWASYGQKEVLFPEAITTNCWMRKDSFEVIFSPTGTLTRGLTAHEIGHALGCFPGHVGGLLSFHHVMAPLVTEWAGLTVQDVDCALAGNHYPRPRTADACWIEFMPNKDLIAPAAMMMYARLEYLQEWEWTRTHWIDNRHGPECDTVRVEEGVVILDDVRSQEWRGSAVIAPEGLLWRLVMAIPH